jgi:hypothetical protein
MEWWSGGLLGFCSTLLSDCVRDSELQIKKGSIYAGRNTHDSNTPILQYSSTPALRSAFAVPT